MTNRFDYAWQKLHEAALGLATHTGPLPERLRDMDRLFLSHLRDDAVPPEITEDCARFSAAARVRRTEPLSELEVRSLLRLVISMYDRVAKYGPNA